MAQFPHNDLLFYDEPNDNVAGFSDSTVTMRSHSNQADDDGDGGGGGSHGYAIAFGLIIFHIVLIQFGSAIISLIESTIRKMEQARTNEQHTTQKPRQQRQNHHQHQHSLNDEIFSDDDDDDEEEEDDEDLDEDSGTTEIVVALISFIFSNAAAMIWKTCERILLASPIRLEQLWEAASTFRLVMLTLMDRFTNIVPTTAAATAESIRNELAAKKSRLSSRSSLKPFSSGSAQGGSIIPTNATRKLDGREALSFLPELDDACVSAPDHALLTPVDNNTIKYTPSSNTAKCNGSKCHDTNNIDLIEKEDENQTLVRYDPCDLEPAFLREEDYPSGWLTYDPVLGVVPKEEAKYFSVDSDL